MLKLTVADYPDLLSEWSRDNPPASTILSGPSKSFAWVCSKCQAKFKSPVRNRTTLGTGCRDCGVKKSVLTKMNNRLENEGSIADQYPYLLDDLDFTANTALPGQLLPVLKARFIWVCRDYPHSYSVTLKTKLGRGICTVCANKVILTGFNDLAMTHPEVAVLWSSRNAKAATSVSYCSGKEYFWVRKNRKHERSSSVKIQIQDYKTCRQCSYAQSSLEEIVNDYLASVYLGPTCTHKRSLVSGIGKLELDIHLPKLRLAFEIQDLGTHSKNSDIEAMRHDLAIRRITYKRGHSYHEHKRSHPRAQLDYALLDIWEDEIRDNSFQAKVSEAIEEACALVDGSKDSNGASVVCRAFLHPRHELAGAAFTDRQELSNEN